MTRGILDAGLAAGLKTIVLFYRLLISPVLGASCRFHPSCSRYALDAIEMHGGRRGGWLTLRRLARCHPWGGAGHDPVPDPSHLAERTR